MKQFTLVGVNGNAFCVLAYVSNAMQQAGFTRSQIANYTKKATVGSYDLLIVESMDMLDECNRRLGLVDCEEDDED